jgi:hypothetical protein
METRYLECNCRSNEHVVRFGWFKDEKEPGWKYLYIETQLSPYMGFFRRLWHALKYVLGVGDLGWGEAMMFPPEARKLRAILNEYIDSHDDFGHTKEFTSGWVVKEGDHKNLSRL